MVFHNTYIPLLCLCLSSVSQLNVMQTVACNPHLCFAKEVFVIDESATLIIGTTRMNDVSQEMRFAKGHRSHLALVAQVMGSQLTLKVHALV